MPDGAAWRAEPAAAPASLPAAHGGVRRTAVAAVLAVALHAAAVLPFVWTAEREPPPTVVEDVEMSPVPEAAAPQAAEAASFAESAAAAAPPEPVQAMEVPPEPVEVPPPPPDRMQATPPEPVQAAVPPENLAPPPPEAQRAEPPPPEPVAALEPEPIEAVPPPEEVAALPPPPPPMPPPSASIRVAPPPRPTPRLSPPAPPAPRAAEAPSTEATAAAPVPPAPTVRRPPPSYIGALLAALERHKEYPSGARWRREEGVALLRFSMRRDGTVAGWQIVRSTGHEDLDAAVERMIRRASPLPPPPPEMAGDPVEIAVPIRFSLR